MASDLFYNRDSNISGVTIQADYSGLELTPVYGSKASFSSKAFSYNTDDFYMNRLPDSMNSLSAVFDVRYDVNESNAQSLIAFIESKNGSDLFEFNIDNSGIYQKLSGVCDNYAVNHMNNQHYEVASSMTVDQAPNLLNWSGMTFLNHDFQNWATSTSYEKYDIIYSGVNINKLDNFYYSTEDHNSSDKTVDGPTGSSSKWSQDFFFEPDIGFQNSVDLKNDQLLFKNSFPLRIKNKDNNASFPISYKFTSITDKQLKAMLHFLENKGGYRNFRHDIPSIYNRPKAMYCPEWSHTWKYKNSHDLEVTLIEDVLGVIKEN
jgi:phage-related protein